MDVAPALPTRFPCWCRAVYSWGGETKRDLGFVEGDLIECLNAGDGSWWMGRLRRDKRAMGLFPSNFVKVLDDSFVPVNRASSPMPDPQPAKPAAQKSKGTFRKPYQSYSAPTETPKSEKKPPRLSPAPSPIPSRQNSYQQHDYHNASKQNSHQERQLVAYGQDSHLRHSHKEEASKRTYIPYSPSRPGSHVGSRAPSPAAHTQPEDSGRYSPNPYEEVGSPPPPPPPPHRVAYNQPSRAPSPLHPTNEPYTPISRTHSPAPHSPSAHGMTPSPLRDAMQDVMSSLHDMQIQNGPPSPPLDGSPHAIDPWSPEAFDELRINSRKRGAQRPQTSLGLGHEAAYPVSDHGGRTSHLPVETSDAYQSEDYVRRMERRLREMQDEPQYLDDMSSAQGSTQSEAFPLHLEHHGRPVSSMETRGALGQSTKLRNRKSAYELGRDVGRTLTTKSTVTDASSGARSTNTNSSSSTQATRQSIMSGYSAGGFSATSAGSLARRKWGSFRKARPISVAGTRREDVLNEFESIPNARPHSPMTGYSYHSSHKSENIAPEHKPEWAGSVVDAGAPLGGLTQLKPKRSGFLRKLVESAKTGAASARSSIAGGGQEVSRNPVKSLLPKAVGSVSSGNAALDMGLGGGMGGGGTSDWLQVRRDINRSNTLSRMERQEKSERCQMLGQPVVDAVDLLEEVAEGDEGIDGAPVSDPTQFQQTTNLQLVDKAARFITSLPPMTNPVSLAQGYVCRPYRSDVQRFRAIFSWVSEKVAWEEDFEDGVDTRRVIQARKGCAQEVAVLVMEMCQAVGLHAEVVRGFLKTPGELPELDCLPRPNHWWNAVLVDGEWRMMDCSLASPTNPKRSLYSSAHSAAAESFYFLMRPLEACYTHIPSSMEQQHIVPAVDPSILLALPCALPPYFRNKLQMVKYSTAQLYLEGLELMQIVVAVPSDTELFAEVTARTFSRDADGDLFESGEHTVKRALAQAEWKNGSKLYTIKALLPGDEGSGVLHVYAGKRGLMHSIKDNPHPLAFSLPIFHTGENPPFDFLIRHPTPHAQRHDLYLSQPQCHRLACNNTFVFSVRQHPSSSTFPPTSPSSAATPNFAGRPASALSMASSSASGSNPSTTSYFQPGATAAAGDREQKPAKLAIQAPSGKILRLSRKIEGGLVEAGGTWETVIKVGERGIWRGLVLADRSARWCVWGEWECV